MRLFQLLLLRSFQSHFSRKLLSLFGIILGVAGLFSISSTNQAAMESINKLFEDTAGKANLILIHANPGEGFRDTLLNQIQRFPGVQTTAPTLHVMTVLTKQAESTELAINMFGTTVQGLMIYGIDPFLDVRLRNYNLAAGKFLSGDLDANEIVLVESYAKENNLEVGDWVEIIASTEPVRLRLVGLISKEGPGQLNNGAFGVMPLTRAQKLFDRSGEIDQLDIAIYVTYQDTASLETLKEALQEWVGSSYSVLYPASQGKRQAQMLQSYQIGLNLLSGMALFVGAFLIFNTFSMTVVERTREFGMLRSIGMTKKQITLLVLLEALILGLIGSILGLLFGLFLARGLVRVMQVLMQQEIQGIGLDLSAFVISALVGVSVTLTASLLPSIQAGKISPLEALRARAQVREQWVIQHGWKAGFAMLAVSILVLLWNPFPNDTQFRLGTLMIILLFLGGTLAIPIITGVWERSTRSLIAFLYSGVGRLGSANIQRSRLRTMLTVAALMVGVSMVIVVWVMTGSFKSDLEAWLDGYIGGDLYITSTLNLSQDLQTRLEALDNVVAATPIRYFEMKWITPEKQKENVTFMAINPGSHVRVTSFLFNNTLSQPVESLQRLAAGGSVFISSVIAEKYGLKENDNILLETRMGIKTFNIAGIVVDYYNQGLVIVGNWNDMRRYFRYNDANTLMVKAKPGTDLDILKDRIDRLYGNREKLVIISNKEIKAQIDTLLKQSFSMFDILALIAMVVAFFGISNTMIMSVFERTREIGMLRSIGLTRGQAIQMITAEASAMGLLGGVVGVLFGAVISHIILLGMTAMSGYRLAYSLPLERVLLGIFAAVVIANLAALLPARRATKISILEAIHYE
jgi:putative ABC transport system permease protein